jgi:hypothetical protein
VTANRYSKSDVALAACVSDGQVGIMRRAQKCLGADVGLYDTWRAASVKVKGIHKEWDLGEIDLWKAMEAERVAERLYKAFGPKMARNPEVFAMALERVYGDKIGELVVHLPRPGRREDDEDDDF